jgi:hypothetical protein
VSDRYCPACEKFLSPSYCWNCQESGRAEAYERGLAAGRAPLEEIIRQRVADHERSEVDARRLGAFEMAVNQQYFAEQARAGKLYGVVRGTPVQFLYVSLDEYMRVVSGDLGDADFLGSVADYLRELAGEITGRESDETSQRMADALAALRATVAEMTKLYGSPEETP